MDRPIQDQPQSTQVTATSLLMGHDVSGKEELLNILRDAIASETLPLGTQLPNERELANAAGLSRSSVRAAMDRLVHEGRVIRHVGRGTFVIDTGADSPSWVDAALIAPAEILAARALIEPTLPSLIVMAASDSELTALEAIALEGRSVTAWQDAEFFDSHFHSLLFEATGNNVIKDVGRFLRRARTGTSWKRIKEQQFNLESWGIYQGEHEQIASALVRRDSASAARYLSTHLATVQTGMRT